jgi:hypothetical protein
VRNAVPPGAVVLRFFNVEFAEIPRTSWKDE